ncbi:MAG: hypothetical protein LBS53_09730 [Synergistaceae bacterium]|jgi:hypothetical protein|nr:hypothetical protein [Synergistaceae bacterium]
MRFLKYFLYAMFSVSVFSAGLCIFAPWDEGVNLAFHAVRLEAARRGYYVTYDGVERDGFFPPSYRFGELDVEGPMAKATFSDVVVKLEPAASALSRSASFHAAFGGSAVRYIPNGGFALERGQMDISAGKGIIAVSDADIKGDVNITGDMVLNAEEGSITESTMYIGVPPEMGAILGSPAMNRFVESVSPGKWRIRENAGGIR